MNQTEFPTVLEKRVIVLDGTTSESRSLPEFAMGAGFLVVESTNLEDFLVKMNSANGMVGILAFEAIVSDPRSLLEKIRKSIGERSRLIVVYQEESPRLKLGQRLWDVGALDYFVPRSTSQFRFRDILRQSYFDTYIGKRVGHYLNSQDAKSVNQDLKWLLSLGPSLLGSRSAEEIWRTLSLQMPQLVNIAIILVLVVEKGEAKIHVLPFRPFDYQIFSELQDKVCHTASEFFFKSLTALEVEFNDVFLNTAATFLPTEVELLTVEPMPMVSHGNLVGCVCIAGFNDGKTTKNQLESLMVPLSLHLGSALANLQNLREVESSSNTDELTGAFNRRYLKTAIDREILRSRRFGSCFSLALVDIDYFKKFNDLYGHLQGDLVLKEFAAFLSSQLRNSDRLFRFGGEEFLLLFVETDEAHAALAMERIRTNLQSQSLNSIRKIGTFRFSFSAGIVSFPACGRDSKMDEIIKLADGALYMAKKTGRNRVCIYEKNSDDPDLKKLKEQRKHPRIDCNINIKYAEIDNFSHRFITTSTVNVGAGGLAIVDPDSKLSKNRYLLVYLSGQQDPMLCRVSWVKPHNEAAARTAGLEFVKDDSLEVASSKLHSNSGDLPRALVIADSPQVVERTVRILTAANFESVIFNNEKKLSPHDLDGFSLIVLGETNQRKEFALGIQKLREEEGKSVQIILINEGLDRLQAIRDIHATEAEHFVSNSENALETMFAGLNKILIGEIFGIKKYLMWGAESKAWMISNSKEKETIVNEIHAFALSIKCHPRIADLLIMGVDEMLINALRAGEANGKNSITVECGSDGRLLAVSVMDEAGALNPRDIYQSLGRAIQTMEGGLAYEHSKSANMGFQIMLSTLSQLSVNVNPGKCTEVIGIIDLRKSLKEYRSSLASFDLFTVKKKPS